ncbi:MAG: glycosyltransferase family 4 protein [bacterium]
MKKLRVLYFSYVPDIQGVSIGPAKKIEKLADGLRKENTYVKIIFRTTQYSFTTKAKAFGRGLLKKYFNEAYHLLMNLKNIVEEYFLIKKDQPDIIITRLEIYNFSGLLLAKLMRIPFILEADSPVIYEYDRIWGKNCLRSFIAEYIERLNVVYADALFVISHKLRDYYLSKGLKNKKIVVIPNGADPHEFYPKIKNSALLNELSLPSKKVIIGWMGSGWSGTKDLVRLAKILLAMNDNIFFLIIGKRIVELEGEHRVFLTGTVEQCYISDYLSLVDIALAPYPHDAFYASPIKIYEYMAAGKVVVASPIPQIMEVIRHGENGIIVDFRNSNAAAKEIITLIDNPELRNKLGQNARQSILEKHTWQGRSRALADMFHQL